MQVAGMMARVLVLKNVKSSSRFGLERHGIGGDDHLVKPEGLPNYVVPPPPLYEQINIQPVQPQLCVPKSGDEDDPDKNDDNSVEEYTEFVASEEDVNIFDLPDQYYF